MRASKISQLTKSLERVTDLHTDIENAIYNDRTEVVIAKLEAREEKALEKAYKVCRTMTQEEYYATDFSNIMCLSYDEAIEK